MAGFIIQNSVVAERCAQTHPDFRKRYERAAAILAGSSAMNFAGLQQAGLQCELISNGAGFDTIKLVFGGGFRIVATFTWSTRRVYLWFAGPHTEYEKLGDLKKKKWTANGLS